MEWQEINQARYPDNEQRVLTYSDCYPDNPEMAYRILSGQFVRICTEVTHWTYLNPPE